MARHPHPRPGRHPRSGHSRRPRPPPSLPVVHEDGEVLVIDKPPGLLSATPPGGRGPSAFDLVKDRVQHRRRGGRAWIIHRLDQDASGLMVFAKSERAFNWLKEDFRARRVERLYLAVLEGELSSSGPAGSGTVQSFLREDRLGQVRSVPARRAGADAPAPGQDLARLAVTAYRVRTTGRGRTLVELRMDSGRKHQLRVHMGDLGHPIVGDPRYGARTNPLGRLGLHAAELGFRHPATGIPVHFQSPAPASFFAAVGVPPPEPASLPPTLSPPARMPRTPRRLETSWDAVAGWYDALLEEKRSDHYQDVILPGTLRLLAPSPGLEVLDLACGQGELCRLLASLGARPTGIDASPRLIEAARRRGPAGLRYEVADVRDLTSLDLGPFDAITCTMALMNIDPLAPVLRGACARLRPGGALVVVILHPAFRAPRQTAWEWDRRARPHRQYRRVEGYLSPGQFEITMNPGEVAAGQPAVTTWTFHRPLQAYVKALADAGFLLQQLEEWPSLRRGPGGRQAAEENRARREIPLFLGFRAIKGSQGAVGEPAGTPDGRPPA